MSTTGNEFADFMLGKAYNYQQLQNQTIPNYINEYFGPWFGDSWKVRSGLTINYGLRWEIMPHAHTQYNQTAVFRTTLFETSQIPQFNPDGSIVPVQSSTRDPVAATVLPTTLQRIGPLPAS